VSEWKDVKLNDIIEIIGGGTPKTSIPEYWNGEIPWLSIADFNNGRKYVSQAEKYITEEGLNSSSTKILYAGDIIISARGTVGLVAVLKKNMAFNQSCYGIKGLIGISETDYIYYLLIDTVENFLQIAHGGVFDTITRDTFKEVLCLLPSLPEQKAIASVLSSLDDKIDLLHRQNKTLEAMAEALFRQWFVEEAQDDWEEGCLGDFAVNVTKSAKVADINSDDVYIGLEHIERRNISLVRTGLGGDMESNKYFFKKMDILFGKLRPYFHKVCFAPFDGICSTDILVIRPKKKHLFGYCLFAFFQDDVVEYANLGSGGTRMPRTDWKTLARYQTTIPDDDNMMKFNNIVCSFVEKIEQNQRQIRTREKLRDSLLPKLMSGEVRVNYA